MPPLPLPASSLDPDGVARLERLLDLVRLGLGLTPRAAPATITVHEVRDGAVHGVLDLLDRAVASGATSYGADASALAERLRRHEVFTALRLRALTHRLLDELGAAGVSVLVFKGVALAAQTGREPSERAGSDIDLLIEPADWAAAHTVLLATGMALGVATPPPTPGSRTRYVRFASYEAEYAGLGVAVDLHWRLGPGHHAPLEARRVLGRGVTVDLDGRPVPTLHPDDALAHTWLHGAKDGWVRLRSTADAHLLITRAGADPDRAAALLGARSSAAVEGPVAERLLRGDAPPGGETAARAAQRWVRGAVERPMPDELDRPPDGYLRAMGSRISLSPNLPTAAGVVAQRVVPPRSLARSRLPARYWLVSITARPFRIVTRLAEQGWHRLRRI